MVSSPYKTIDEDKVQKVGIREIKNIQHQLNYSNKILSEVSKAVERIENLVLPTVSKIPPVDPRQPIFQPNSFKIGPLKEDPSDLFAKINRRLSSLSLNKRDSSQKNEVAKSINVVATIPTITQASSSTILLVTMHTEVKNHYPRPSPPDMGWDDLRHDQRTYDESSIITWNIDGYSEAQMMNTFQEMMMAATAFSTKKPVLQTAQILISSLSGNLRSWWHNQLTDEDRTKILIATKAVVKQEGSNAMQIDEPDMVNQLIYAMTKNFIGSTQVYSDLNAEALLSLRCRKMSNYKWYKDTFLARLYTITTCGADIWKQKFVEGLPHYIAQKFYQTVVTNSTTNRIDWAELTIGDINATIQQICVNLCLENKHTAKVIKEPDYRKELGTFCKQYGLDDRSEEERKKKKKSSNKRLFSKSKSKDSELPRRKRKYYNRNKGKKDYSKNRPHKSSVTCYKCNRKGHYSSKCPLKDKINSLTIDEKTRRSLLYAIRSEEENSSSSESSTDNDEINLINEEDSDEETFFSQSDSSEEDGIIPCTGHCAGKCHGHINVINKDQEALFDLIDQLPDEDSKRMCLVKLRESLEAEALQKKPEVDVQDYFQNQRLPIGNIRSYRL
ncbi:uncharacterized protein LOC111019629 [Momordica charantia]|uniref:Uncharacterized protein LOC111019629 n=1 Tax=Momordica charantia TaxID=3673 RepID=A0A6J1DFI7_MOMCH|nr:uncharacterized protein LOC111019629 [Momordica charantia]